MRQLPEIPDGVDDLLAVIKADHHRIAELAHLEFAATDEEMGTRFETAFETEAGTRFVLVEPAYEPELGVNVHILPGTDKAGAEAELLESLGLETADLSWRATALNLNVGDVVSVDPDAPEQYHPDAVAIVVDVAYEDHEDLVPQPGVNPAVYSVQLESGPVLAIPSNFVQWEPILHAESVRSSAGFANFLSALTHHMAVQPDQWQSGLTGHELLGHLVGRIGEREAVAARARSQLQPSWGMLAAAILEVVAPPSWAPTDGDDPA